LPAANAVNGTTTAVPAKTSARTAFMEIIGGE
jgi:hypothetical protein